ncbi:MAG: PTS sugar transporter subunit IIB [Coprobacillus sp.]|nr:PTS sugar transporter subunit IIB [Coprobacillus sp.]MCI9093230.1 PTS sugar transporter subunit IIB [Coprobacillus sp.]
MKKIMLVCAAGMSTSLLVTKMEAAAKEVGDEIKIFALPISDGEKKLHEVDCVLLGPQVRFQKAQIEKLVADAGLDLPIDVINMKDYGMMNGKAVYEFALNLMKK